MPKSFIYDGKRYERFEDLPPEGREAYEKLHALLKDRDRDGIPDIMQGGDAETFGMIDSETVFAMQNMPGWMKRLLGKFGNYVLRDVPGIDPDFRGGRETRVTLQRSDAAEWSKRIAQARTSPARDDFSRARTAIQLVLLALFLITLCAMAVFFIFPWLQTNFL